MLIQAAHAADTVVKLAQGRAKGTDGKHWPSEVHGEFADTEEEFADATGTCDVSLASAAA